MKKKSIMLMLFMIVAAFLFACSKSEDVPENKDIQPTVTQEKNDSQVSPEPSVEPKVNQSPDINLPDNPKQIIYNQNYNNNAETAVNTGYLICADGGIYYYNYAYGALPWMEVESDQADKMSDFDYVTTYTTPVGCLDEAVLKEFYDLIQKVDMQEMLQTENVACDAGSRTKSISTDGVQFCILSETGDYEGELTGQGAKAALEFIDKAIKPVISDCSVPYNEENILVIPNHCEVINLKDGNWNIKDSSHPLESSAKYLIRTKGEADYLKEVYNIDLQDYLANYTDYYSYVYYALVYTKVYSTGFNIRYSCFDINSNGIMPIPSLDYSAPDDEFYDDGTGVQEFVTIAEIPIDSLYFFYNDDYAVPEWSSFPEYNRVAEEYAVKIGDDFHVDLISEKYYCSEDTCTFTFENDRNPDMVSRLILNVVCDRNSGNILGAFLLDSELQWSGSHCCIFDAEGNIVLDEEKSKPFTLLDASEYREEDAVLLYNDEDIRCLDTMKDALLSVSDIESMDEFSDEITIVDEDWYKITLFRELAREKEAADTITYLTESLMFIPDFPIDYGWSTSDEGVTLADYGILIGKLSDGTDYIYEIKETPDSPENESYYEYSFYDKDGNLFCSSDEIWETYTDGGALRSIRITDADGEERFCYDGVMSYISGVDINKLRDEMEADKAEFDPDADEIISYIRDNGLDYIPVDDVFKTLYLTSDLDDDHTLKVDMLFFDYMGEADVYFIGFINDDVIFNVRAFGGH